MYRIRPDGSIETESAEEALKLTRLMADQSTTPVEAAAILSVHAKTKRKPKSPTFPPHEGGGSLIGHFPVNSRPKTAVNLSVDVGQIWESYGDGRVVQIEQLFEDGVMPRILKMAKGAKRAMRRKIAYHVLLSSYKRKN